VIDDGRLTDSQGRTVDFKNTIIIMTSNIGSKYISDISTIPGTSEYMEQYERVVEKVYEEMRHIFRPEFLNRTDEIVAFNPLTMKELKEIVNLLLGRTNEKLKEKGLILEFADDVKTFVINKGYDPIYGARPLRRAIQKYIENPLAEFLLRENVEKGIIECYIEKGEMKFRLNERLY